MNTKPKVTMGQMTKNWKDHAKSITFCVTEDCNLACKYCYMTGKNSFKKMTFDTAKEVVDYILKNRDLFLEESVMWDFIGGEPFLEIELIDEVSDYIKQQMFLLDHPWFNSYRFCFSSNGLLYETPKVQHYVQKNRAHLSIGISLDGNKIKHDMQRVRCDGSGSYDDVLRNIRLLIKQFPHLASTKSTFSHDDLPYLKDSVISLWDNGIKSVMANIVFEDVWHEGDDIIFENQLRELADYVIENEMWREYSVRFFDPNIGNPLEEESLKKNFCGAGKMLAVDCEGKFYPCIRFLDFSLNNRKPICTGDVNRGIEQDKLRPLLALSLEAQSNEECIKCEVATGCAWCTGSNYDSADTDTVYQRATYLCKMHKANVRANKYFWEKFSRTTGLVSPREQYQRERTMQCRDENNEAKYLMLITEDGITPHCNYRNWRKTDNKMSDDIVSKGLDFAEKNGFIPVFLGSNEGKSKDYLSIVEAEVSCAGETCLYVFDNNVPMEATTIGNDILLVNLDNINRLSELVKAIKKSENRINVILEDIEIWGEKEIEEYSCQLDKLMELIVDTYKENNLLEVNILTDRLNLKSMRNCTAGNNTFTLAPNGKFYICPAFYFDDPLNDIGDVNTGINIKNNYLLEYKNAPLCSNCDAYHCRRCKYLNKKLTNEINTPSRIQCVISHIERNKSAELQKKLAAEISDDAYENRIPKINYLDPLEIIENIK